ncbi:uncharacterized protein (TIGR00297 family) [Anaerosolibacter carboniphilus]|uniref:Uncharacterized protein (TIGR00297 family) n=1 Tax=Anaerosolibacter carboniphilus TaxID=1417629 RepID=A0A841KT51_9FIRM|nr:DUF92 domain-containing protein [Anaerosolibacter carboniphilus]MBB6214092.1 uncharacterized protein (TIGR00297 family) [Anaerosolibacter carboniphilus]
MPSTYYIFSISILIFTVGWSIYKLKWITLDALAALWLIGLASGINGFFWLFPLGYFLLTGSLLTKLQTDYKKRIKSKEKSARNWKQLSANGFLAAVSAFLYFLLHEPVYYYIYITAIAVNLFDTWCAETGTLFPAKTYSLYKLKVVPQGVSGGITLGGTLGGYIGFLGYLMMVYILSWLGWLPPIAGQIYGLISISGILGGFFDSFLGIFENEKDFEGVYRHIQKIAWLQNNMVNFLSSVFGCLIFFIFYLYLYGIA